LNWLKIRSNAGFCKHCNGHLRTVRALITNTFHASCFNSFSSHVLYKKNLFLRAVKTAYIAYDKVPHRCGFPFSSLLWFYVFFFFFFSWRDDLQVPARYFRGFVCRMSALQVKIVFLLNALQPIMLFTVALTCAGPEFFP
jgi:hypothetical protein